MPRARSIPRPWETYSVTRPGANSSATPRLTDSIHSWPWILEITCLAEQLRCSRPYNNYVAASTPFSSWNPGGAGPDPTLGTISALAWKFIQHAEQQGQGYQVPAQRMMNLLQLFNSSMLASYDPSENTESASTFRSTLMVTALSYAFSKDLRSSFQDLNFPIDNQAFEQLYEMATGGGAKVSPATEAFGGSVP